MSAEHALVVPHDANEDTARALYGLLEANPHLTSSQKVALVASVMGYAPAPTLPERTFALAAGYQGTPMITGGETSGTTLPALRQPVPHSLARILLRPGVVQAEALAANYALALGLDLSGAMQQAAVPGQAVLLATNYLVLMSLMMGQSLLCLAHAFIKCDLRAPSRAVLMAMATTGVFGMLEYLTFTTPYPLDGPMRLLFVITVPLISLLVFCMSVARGLQEETAAPLQSPAVASIRALPVHIPSR